MPSSTTSDWDSPGSSAAFHSTSGTSPTGPDTSTASKPEAVSSSGASSPQALSAARAHIETVTSAAGRVSRLSTPKPSSVP